MDRLKIFIVDDDKTSLRLICAGLAKLSYDCIPVESSRSAVALAEKTSPDLFLLDMVMPGMGGIELCRKIKESPSFHNTPVIFLTMAEEPDQKLAAFTAGAVDYITKPINMRELGARVKAHLELYKMRQYLAQYAGDMRRLAEERSQQLIHANRLATIGLLYAELAHEIKNPLTFISGNIQTLEKFWHTLREDVLEHCGAVPEKDEKVAFIAREIPAIFQGAYEGIARIQAIIGSLKNFAHKGPVRKQAFLLKPAVDDAIALCTETLKEPVHIDNAVPPDIDVNGDPQQMVQVFVNLITNSIDATKHVAAPHIKVHAVASAPKVEVLFSDNGSGVPVRYLDKIWEPFFTTKEITKGTGLGLYVARSIVESFGGNMCAANGMRGGFEVSITLMRGRTA